MVHIAGVEVSTPMMIGAAVALVVIIILAYFMFSGSTSVLPVTATGTFLWDPNISYTTNPADALVAGSDGVNTIYVAAIKDVSGNYTIAKATKVYGWYSDGTKEIRVPVSQVMFLPASAVGGASWASVLTRGVALVTRPDERVCRLNAPNGVHPGFVTGGNCVITYGGKGITSPTFEYLNAP